MNSPDPAQLRAPVGPVLTINDKALLLRAARIIRVEAELLRGSMQSLNESDPWAGPEGKAQKRTYDRYLREERDLRELAKRAA